MRSNDSIQDFFHSPSYQKLEKHSEVIVPTVCGTVAFGTTLALSTFAQLQLHVSTGTRPLLIPWGIGFLSVGLASLASHYTAIYSHKCIVEGCMQPLGKFAQILKQRREDETPFYSERLSKLLSNYTPAYDIQINPHSLRICCVGLIAFKIFGGRFWGIAPSSFTQIGSFARLSIPASSSSYASSLQRKSIERIGRLSGCHTCGSRVLLSTGKSVKFHADHMPPNAVVKQMNDKWFRRLLGISANQRFFPQCTKCSGIQGGILASATNELRNYLKTGSKFLRARKSPNLARAGGGKAAHFHGFRFRTSHLAGAVVASSTVYKASPIEIQHGNPQRFKDIECVIEGAVLDAVETINEAVQRISRR